MASVQENIIKNNNIGVAFHSASGLNIENDLMDGNALAGVTFVNTDESMVTSNNIQGSQNAIFLDSQSTENTVQLNNAHDNVVDINNANGLNAIANQNTFVDNDCQISNPAGLCVSLNSTESQIPAGWSGWVNATRIQDSATQQTTPQNSQAAQILINDSIQDLQNSDIGAALTHLDLAKQELATSADASTNSISVLVNDAIQDLQNNDTNAALTHLNLAIQQLEG